MPFHNGLSRSFRYTGCPLYSEHPCAHHLMAFVPTFHHLWQRWIPALFLYLYNSKQLFDGLFMVAYPLCGSAAVWTCKYYVLLLFVLCLFGLIHAWLLSYGYVPLVWSCLPQFGWVYLYQSGEERSSFSFRGARVVKILPFMLHIAIFISLNILDARLPIIQLD